jgi:hypothetical protein
MDLLQIAKSQTSAASVRESAALGIIQWMKILIDQ